jgi:NAD(P)-dependent dehydrogenase (short-subunit alcohol dehydrogenase family)
MELRGRVVVVTGAASGIGHALCVRFAREGLAGLVAVDIDAAGAEAVALDCGGVALRTDVSVEADVRAAVHLALDRFGRVDVFASNAGIFVPGDETATLDADWERVWGVNVKAHIHAARAVLPSMLERGEGYLLQTVSAAGLLNQIGSASYGVSKHAALGFAEWLAIQYGDRGIRVSAICPQGVRTPMLHQGLGGGRKSFLEEGAIDPADVAEAAVAGIAAEQFLILPHPEVGEYFQRKASDYDRWLRGMRRLQAKVT